MTPKRCWTGLLLVILISLGAACTDLRNLSDGKQSSGKNGSDTRPSPSPDASPTPKSTPVVPGFKGDIAGKAGKQRLFEFFEAHKSKLVKLDLLLSDAQLGDLDAVDKGKRWYFDLSYEDENGFNSGGELLIDISRGMTGLQLDGNHLQGMIQVTQWAGPHQGVMSINARPVSNEPGAPKSSPSTKNPGVTTRPAQ